MGKITMVSKELVEELRVIIKEEYGRGIDYQQASQIANGLVGYFSLLAKLNRRIINDEYNNEKHEKRESEEEN